MYAIVPAGGSGQRMGGAIKKQFLELGGMSVLAHTLRRLSGFDMIDGVILAAPADEIATCRDDVVGKYDIRKVMKIVEGGKTRQDSVYNAFVQAPDDAKLILVHDAVRPFVTERIIRDVIDNAERYGAAIVAIPVKDTLKKITGAGFIESSVSRDHIVRVQTPQCFKRELLERGFREALRDGYMGTDESSLLDRLGIPVHISDGAETNIKITTPEDLKLAELYLNYES